MQPRTIAFALTLILALGTSACGGNDQTAEEAQSDAPAMPGMQGMGGMEGMHMGESGAMMREMTAHMQMMEGMTGDSAAAMLRTHRQVVGNMMAQMNREMADMNMGADARWNATVDSLREDLIRMPELSPGELDQLMPDHRARVERLMEMHEEMMRGM